ncbi:2-oxoglutarate dehydrogenase E1 component [Oceanobacillus halophilus]|uniref:2-oxoglutarate dehydrogenase E1 component n=1 Tax=Oceanobacillus halophilus TaxID=930130 RepID=A0A494ZW59_9BACI|nr:2-oxoglutarate dehydrogenase E1 component [Oceanobacillus halophilus]RKQ30886.1 2-oxoglutarate dehydrogenase E1 component [Oceanobacillus halophilus]
MNDNNGTNPWADVSGPNMGYLLEQYDLYSMNPESVDQSFRELFDQWGEPSFEDSGAHDSEGSFISPNILFNKMRKLVAAISLADNIRLYGHTEADIFPLDKQPTNNLLDLASYQLTEADLREIPAEFICKENNNLNDGVEAIAYLKQTYTSAIGFEVRHLEPEKKEWLQKRIESTFTNEAISNQEKEKLLKGLVEAEAFEQFLGKTYVGQKRFSVEGLESLVPVMNEIVRLSAMDNIHDVMISMAHRGRLNVLTHVLDKPYEAMLSQFQHSEWKNKDLTLELTEGETGDVKYHLGAKKQKKINDRKITVTLANNPSHLEFSGTVAEGYTRAAQEVRTEKGYPQQDVSKAVAVLVHGDAAFTGQGVVTEILNYANTKAYGTGGTIHVIANNCIGFTTEPEDDRSTKYPSDIVKGYNVPIIHVNADDPENCMKAVKLAFEFRQTFHQDVLINLIGYRRLGHNEMDEPRTTSPLIYQAIDQHPTITEIYKKQLLTNKVLSESKIKEMEKEISDKLNLAYQNINQDQEPVRTIAQRHAAYQSDLPKVDTTVDNETLSQINNQLLEWPEGFNVFGKLKKILNRRKDAVDNHKKIDWGHAEVLAFASILKDGTPIRITGQDSERGTFSHRNIVLSDEKTGEKFSPLHTVGTSKASFAVHNSTLSETAILGFEYGYDVFAKETLVFWEAQFGDFANGAQVIFDQFIASGREKWGQKSGLVMLLPHGYEGQGPEHSSARLERFLQSAAENNWTVANLSTSGNYFHILRRQAALLQTDEVRPLVIMSPKSLLRNAAAGVYLEELTNGGFEPIIEEPGLGTNPEKVKRIVFTTGRLAVELSETVAKDKDAYDWLDIIRVEELYPFPKEKISHVLNKYENLEEIVWSQEEPQNMGAWSYIYPRLQELAPKDIEIAYNGRPDMASPSEGDPLVHKVEQKRIINNVLTQTVKSKKRMRKIG